MSSIISTDHKKRRANWWNFRLWAFNAFLVLISPLILLRKWKRYRKKGLFHEIDPLRWSVGLPQCLSQATTGASALPSAAHIVFVGSGIGELKAIECLTDELEKERPDVHVVWALRGRDVCKLASEAYPKRELTTVPFEFIWPLWKWTHALKPDVVVIIEELRVPNLIWCSKCSGAYVVACNSETRGRALSTDGFFWKAVNSWGLRGIDSLCLQREDDLETLSSYLPRNTDCRVAGAVKFESSARIVKRANAEIAHSLAQWLNRDSVLPLLVAGSTHPGEEEFVLEAWQEVVRLTPCALLIAPRRHERSDEIERMLQSCGLKANRRSQWLEQQAPNGAGHNSLTDQSLEDAAVPNVYLLDTIGELSTVYQFGVSSYIGGTLTRSNGGHNVVEPLAYGVPCAFGLGNGRDNAAKHIRDICRDAGVGFEVTTPAQLAAHWHQIVTHPALQKQLCEKTSILLEQHKGAAQRNIAAILQFLPNQAS